MVQQIHVLRTGKREGSESSAEGEWPSARLQALEEELLLRQQNAPLVFPQVDESVVAAIVADWTGIPVGRMVKDEVAAVFRPQSVLDERVIGQSQALAAIAEHIQTARARLTDPNKPVGVFLLVGPSGVGKTETALVLAEAMYGGEKNLITINMSEFQEPHTVSTLKVFPPRSWGVWPWCLTSRWASRLWATSGTSAFPPLLHATTFFRPFVVDAFGSKTTNQAV